MSCCSCCVGEIFWVCIRRTGRLGAKFVLSLFFGGAFDSTALCQGISSGEKTRPIPFRGSMVFADWRAANPSSRGTFSTVEAEQVLWEFGCRRRCLRTELEGEKLLGVWVSFLALRTI